MAPTRTPRSHAATAAASPLPSTSSHGFAPPHPATGSGSKQWALPAGSPSFQPPPPSPRAPSPSPPKPTPAPKQKQALAPKNAPPPAAPPVKQSTALARKERNRIAAQASRDRKAREMEELREENTGLRERIARLEKGGAAPSGIGKGGNSGEEARLRKELKKAQVENGRLRGELEELRREDGEPQQSDGADEDEMDEDGEQEEEESEGSGQSEEGAPRSTRRLGKQPAAGETEEDDSTPVSGLNMSRSAVFGLFQRMVGINKDDIGSESPRES